MSNNERLLTEEERGEVDIPCELACGQTMPDTSSVTCLECIATVFCKAQDAKTSKLVAREMSPTVEQLLLLAHNGDFSNGIVAEGVDEGDVRAYQIVIDCESRLKCFKQKYSVEDQDK